MHTSTATFYDGQSSKRHQVTLTCDEGEIKVAGDGIARSYAVSDLHIDDGLMLVLERFHLVREDRFGSAVS